jgi:hypothetical protein
MKTKGKAYLNKPSVIMKKLILMLVVLMGVIVDVSAKPKLHFEFSGDVVIGRPKKGCRSVWVCIENYQGSVKLELGMIKKGHGIVLDEEGTLYLAVNKELLRKQDLNKYNLLTGGTLNLDDQEKLDAKILSAMGYKGSNIFPAGNYRVMDQDGYFLIKLN